MDEFDAFFSPTPVPFDPRPIEREWAALQGAYDVNRWKLPLPVWAQRGYEHTGDQAWESIQRDPALDDPEKPMCIYLHVPFCSSKCGFCDSYSFALSPSRAGEKQAYVDHLCAELDLWSETGNLCRRPISSVHLGGGTPGFLGEEQFARLIYTCMDRFNVGPQTEWALESNTSVLTPSMISTLHELGFRRLHIGVQSMEDGVRKVVGRRQPTARVLEVIREIAALNWVISVDLVCGLPEQSLAGVLDGIQALTEAGVNGFSLYELLIYPQNRKWAAFHHLVERDHLPNYFMFQAGARLLEERGFQKNLFNHWADARDQNIYFTFPLRGEDLLAVGAIADGVFGDYHYRHPGYEDYLRWSTNGSPGLLGGLRRTPAETNLFPLILAIQSGRISPEQAVFFNTLCTPDGQPLLDHWQTHGLIAPVITSAPAKPGGFRLTASGSWFAGNMIAEIRAAMEIIESNSNTA